MKLESVVRVSDAIRKRGSRKAKVALLGELLGECVPDELSVVVSFLVGSLPMGRIGVGPASVRSSWKAAPSQQSSLSVGNVVDRFTTISSTVGKGSKKRREDLLTDLMATSTEAEQSFLGRLLVGDLRQGAQTGVMVEAIAAAADVPASAVRRAAMLSGDLPVTAVAAFDGGESALAAFKMQVGTPLQPMLAQTAADPATVIERLGRAALDYKLDGARVQVHKEGDSVRVFTRRLHDVTHAVPEIVEEIRTLSCKNVILDGETIALRQDGSPHPFQTTMRRFGRKLDVEVLRKKLPLRTFYFDVLLVDERELIDCTLEERWEVLRNVIPKEHHIPWTVAESSDDVEQFYGDAVDAGHEGIMGKALNSTYQAGARGYSWLKLKPAHTLDLVVLAAEWGSGRRKGWLSNLHLGARDEATGEFVMLGKTFKGMTDAMLTWQTEALQKLETDRDDYTVYVRPELVVEVAFNDVQLSPQYPGGVALRFARLKAHRPDKRANEADTFETVRALAPSED